MHRIASHISQVAIEGWSSSSGGAAATDVAVSGVCACVCCASWIIDGSYIGRRTDSCMYGTAARAAHTARAYDATWARLRGGGRIAVCTFR